jgi:putative membrane protein
MPLSDSDPRVFFAAERTLLAWVRTGITIMALGFVISRFGLFVQLLTLQSSNSQIPKDETLSALIGVLFVLIGGFAIFLASIQHQRFVNSLPSSDLPASYSKRFTVSLSTIIGLLGVALAGYLWIAGT